MIGRRIALGLLTFFSIGVALVAPMPWVFGLVAGVEDAPPILAHLLERYVAARALFLTHVVGGGIALFVGPWQLFPWLRARVPRLHRATGYVYATAVAAAGLAGLVMATHAWAGPVARSGFALLALAWLTTTAIGVSRAVAGDRAGHRAWILRSFALTFAAVSLRVQSPLLGLAGVPDETAYALVAWSSWVPNLLVVQRWVARNSAGARPVQRRNARVNELCSENPSR